MNQSKHFLSMVDKYINDNFDSLVSSPERMEIYSRLMEVRTMLQFEVAQIEKAERMANHPHTQTVKQREDRISRKEIIDKKKRGVYESMKLSQFIPKIGYH